MAVAPLREERTWRGSLVCSSCGYGIARDTPPGPCPMCRADDSWVQPSRRRFADEHAGGGEQVRGSP